MSVRLKHTSSVIQPSFSAATSVLLRCRAQTVSLKQQKYARELEAAVDVVERASQLCHYVQARMLQNKKSSDSQRIEKKDLTPVTVADFAVQALISMELGRLFPSIPLLGEEDATQLRAEYFMYKSATKYSKIPMVEIVKEVVEAFASTGPLSSEMLLDAIDRGAQFSYGRPRNNVSTYWVLDPIDGTKGFLRGGEASYVIGLALISEGNIVLGVMGSPNVNSQDHCETSSLGHLMVACIGCGCWARPLRNYQNSRKQTNLFVQCAVDKQEALSSAIFCISEHEVMGMLPLSQALGASNLIVPDKVKVLRLCCGSLCKYFAIALGEASIFMLNCAERTQLKTWDHAAGVICVLEAGGKVSDAAGKNLEDLIVCGKRSFIATGGGIIVSNGVIHHGVLKILREYIHHN